MMKATDKHTLSYYMTSFFKKYLPGQKNLSPNTIRAYADAFKLLLIYCEEEKGIKSDRLKLENIVYDKFAIFILLPKQGKEYDIMGTMLSCQASRLLL